MALDEKQKYKIMRLLGYPFGTIDPNSMDFSNFWTQRLTTILPAAQVEVEFLLDELDAIDAQLQSKIAQAGIKRIDDIEFYENSHKVLKSEKMRVINDLSQLLGLPNLKGKSVSGVIV